MDNKTHSSWFTAFVSLVTVAGLSSVVFSIFNFEWLGVNFSYLIFMSVAILIASRLTISIPRSAAHLSFSDTITFLAMVSMGGEIAILLATIEATFNCGYLKYKGIGFAKATLLFNIFSSSFATAATYFTWNLLDANFSTFDIESSRGLIVTLATLAVTQFATLSILAALFYSHRDQLEIWTVWKNVCFTSSSTQIIGAVMTGVVLNLIRYADIVTFAIAFAVFGFAYINYRQMFGDINDSINQAEQAEKEKAEIARQQVLEAQEHTRVLEGLLAKEEKISTDLRQSKQDLEHAAFHDNLTDLPNRAYLIERLELLMKLGAKVSKNYYVLFLDLARFKNINDSLGHTIGDEVLKVVALRLRRTLRDEDTAARLGGDEFAIVLNDIESLEDAKRFAQEVHHKLSQPYNILENRIYCDLNIGIAPFDSEQIKPEDVLRDADIAMHNAKDNNIGIAVFDKDVRSEYLQHIKLEGDLRYAADRGEFSMHYQPLINLSNGDLRGFEALMRWHHPELGFVSPAKFIPICEDSGMIIPITVWILNETTKLMAGWQKIHHDYRNMLVSVNISGRHLSDKRLISDVESALESSGLRPSCLKLEITESIAMENAEKTIEILRKLKSLGVKISIDDFGTGYSSLSYLHRLPFDTLKIDRSFVINVSERNEDTQILETIVSLTKTLKKEVIAEGIETEEQLAILQELGCDYGQGYLFSRPLPVPDMETELYRKKNWLPHIEEPRMDTQFIPENHASLF